MGRKNYYLFETCSFKKKYLFVCMLFYNEFSKLRTTFSPDRVTSILIYLGT